VSECPWAHLLAWLPTCSVVGCQSNTRKMNTGCVRSVWCERCVCQQHVWCQKFIYTRKQKELLNHSYFVWCRVWEVCISDVCKVWEICKCEKFIHTRKQREFLGAKRIPRKMRISEEFSLPSDSHFAWCRVWEVCISDVCKVWEIHPHEKAKSIPRRFSFCMV